MNFSQIKEHVQKLSGNSNDAEISSAIQLAAQEVWNTVDLPGVVREIRSLLPVDYCVTLPWQVYKIRMVRNSYNKLQIEQNTIHAQYQDYRQLQSEYQWRVVRRQPLQSRITNAGRITFSLRVPDVKDNIINIIGETDLCSRVVESVTITAGNLSSSTVNRFINMPESIQKDAGSISDIDIKDLNGTVLGVFPNFLTESSYHLVSIHDRCVTQNPYTNTVDILYKPHMPELTDNADVFPDPYSQIVIFKAMEQLKLTHDDTIEVAQAYNEKAATLMSQFTQDEMIGKVMRPNQRRTSYGSPYPANI